MRLPLCLVFLVSPLHLTAQEAAETAPAAPPGQEVLRKGIARMAELGGYRFRTTEVQNSAMNRRIVRQVGAGGQAVLGGIGGAEVEVRGDWMDGILRFKLNDDADEVVSYRGRMIARGDDVGWKLRRDRLANGQPMPFVLDPARLFEALQSLPPAALKVRHQQASNYKGKEVLILGITLEDEDAQDFALSGALPAVSSIGGGAMMIFGGAGGIRMGGGAMPDLTVDLAIYVDPSTDYVHRVQVYGYQKSAGGGAVQIQIQGAGAGAGGEDEEEEEEEVKERDDQGNRNYRRGLPVRKLGENTSKLEFDVLFTEHAMPVKLELDERARKLLRLPSVTAPVTDK